MSDTQDIYNFVTQLNDGKELDQDLFLNLVNVCKDLLEDERPWQYLKKLDTSNSISAGHSSTTPIALPSDFRYDFKVFVGQDSEYQPVPFEEWHLYRNSGGNYTIDHGNSNLYVLGNVGTTNTLYFYYIKTTPELTLTTAPLFPSRFWKLLGFMVMAMYEGAVDYDEVFARMSPENRKIAESIKMSMVAWDNQLQNRARGMRLKYANERQPILLGNM